MKIEWVKKLTSRKFWVAIADFVGMLLIALHVDEGSVRTTRKSQHRLGSIHS